MNEPILSPEAVDALQARIEADNRKINELADNQSKERYQLRDQIAALTAQNEVQSDVLRYVAEYVKEWGICGDDEVLEARVRHALSLTPADALERVKRDAEERRLLLDLEEEARKVAKWGNVTGFGLMAPELADAVTDLDNFRKGAGR